MEMVSKWITCYNAAMCKLNEEQQKRKNKYIQDLRTRKTILTPICGLILLFFLEFMPFVLLLRCATEKWPDKKYSIVEIYVAVFLALEIALFFSWQKHSRFP